MMCVAQKKREASSLARFDRTWVALNGGAESLDSIVEAALLERRHPCGLVGQRTLLPRQLLDDFLA